MALHSAQGKSQKPCTRAPVSKNLPHPILFLISLVVVQSLNRVRLFVTPWTTARQASFSPTISQNLPKFMSIASVMPSNHLILCCPLLLPSIFPSTRVFSSESAVCIRWPKCLSFSFSISPYNEYSGLISFRINWFDIFAAWKTLKSLLQHHRSGYHSGGLDICRFSVMMIS